MSSNSFLAAVLSVFVLYIGPLLSDETAIYIVDTFYDDDVNENWVVLSSEVTDEFEKSWDESLKWDSINEHIETNNGRHLDRKCQNVFGHSLCLCGFERVTDTKYNCHKQAKGEEARQSQLRAQYEQQLESQSFNAIQQQYDDYDGNDYNDEEDEELLEEEVENEEREELAELVEEEAELNEEIADALKIEAKQQLIDDEAMYDEQVAAARDEYEDIADDDNYYNELVEEEETAQDDYYEEVVEQLEVAEDELETQNELIDEQQKLINELREDNAVKEELIDFLEEEEDEQNEEQKIEQLYEQELELNDEIEENENEFIGHDIRSNAQIIDDYNYYDNDDIDEYDDDEYDDDDEEYDDNIDQYDDENYDELYDVNGDSDNAQYFEGDEGSEYDNLEKEEADEMIADTFWGLEVYGFAFGLLCCCCICCYLQKTKCFGLLENKNKGFGTGYSHNGYTRYGGYRRKKSGFNKVFGAEHDDDNDDVEMGVDEDQSDSEQLISRD